MRGHDPGEEAPEALAIDGARILAGEIAALDERVENLQGLRRPKGHHSPQYRQAVEQAGTAEDGQSGEGETGEVEPQHESDLSEAAHAPHRIPPSIFTVVDLPAPLGPM